MMNTLCRWLCSMYYLTCSPINLNSESPEAWLKIGCVKVLLYLPPDPDLAGYSIILHRSLLLDFPQEGHQKNNNTLYISFPVCVGYSISYASEKFYYPNEYSCLLSMATVN